MIRYIDEHRDQFGVEAICRVLRPAVRGFITARGYRAAKTRPPSARALKDELLVPEIARLHGENYGVYGCGRCTPWSAARAGRSAATRPLG